jgi:hypothetical protein
MVAALAATYAAISMAALPGAVREYRLKKSLAPLLTRKG